ncbi:hypothetical protein CRUP_030179, partial [Coryphaenoides rupestris]
EGDYQWNTAIQVSATGGSVRKFTGSCNRSLWIGGPEDSGQSQLGETRARQSRGGVQAVASRRNLMKEQKKKGRERASLSHSGLFSFQK